MTDKYEIWIGYIFPFISKAAKTLIYHPLTP